MDRIARYGGLKNRSLEMAGYIDLMKTANPKRPDIARLHGNITQCANYLVFHDYYTVEEMRLVKATTCKKSLLCPFCAARRAAKMVEKNLAKVKAVTAAQRSLKPVMITFTVKNGESLPERFNHLRNAYRRLQQRRRDHLKGKTWTEFAKVRGAIHSYEITNKGEGWHPHIHMVALLDDWIDQGKLSAEWQELTGDSFIVDIRRIKPKDIGAGGLDIASGLLEVFKYAVKFQDMSLEDTWYAYGILKGKRLVDSFGALRGIEMPESLLDDPLKDLPYIELFYKYSRRKAAFDLESTAKREPDRSASDDGEERTRREAWVNKYSVRPLVEDCPGPWQPLPSEVPY